MSAPNPCMYTTWSMQLRVTSRNSCIALPIAELTYVRRTPFYMCGWRQRHNLSSGWIAQQFVIKSFSKSVKFTFYDEKMEKSADRTFLVVEDFDKWVQQIITSNVGLQNAAVSIFNIKPPFLPQHMICISFVAAKSLFLHLNVFEKTTQFTFWNKH